MVLGEIAFRPARVSVDKRLEAQATAIRYRAILQDVSVTAADGVRLQGWFASHQEGQTPVSLFRRIYRNASQLSGEQ
jgi:hypothetical protein